MISGYTIVLQRTLYQRATVQVDAHTTDDAVEQAFVLADKHAVTWDDVDEEVDVYDYDVGAEFGSDGA